MNLTYNAPPTISRFMQSPAFGRLIAGPVGSGKTYGIIIEILRRALEQAPGEDGLRWTRFAILRQTLKQLKDTVVKDIELIIRDKAESRVSDSTIRIWFGDVRCELLLIPLEELRDQSRLLSSQLTGAWLSECIDLDINLLGPIQGRLGRFPSASRGVPTWSGLIADTNFPMEGTDWQTFMENAPTGWEIFKQPSGLSPEAENLPWLNQNADTLKLPEGHPDRILQGRRYYERLVEVSSEAFANRYVRAQYGTDPSGEAVFRSSFKRSFHVMPELEPVAGRMLVIGQDFGRNPWSLICQLDHNGRFLVLEEVAGENTGLEQHLRFALRPTIMQERYMGRPVCVVGDPAGRAKSTIFEVNEFDILKKWGFSAFPAPTNDLDPRLRAIENLLLGQRNGGAQFLVDGSRCPRFVQALAGSYRYTNTKLGIGKPTPDKNSFSHVMDAGQYAALVVANPDAYNRANSVIMNSGAARLRQPAPSARAWT